jgi:hypothetical protein
LELRSVGILATQLVFKNSIKGFPFELSSGVLELGRDPLVTYLLTVAHLLPLKC